MSLAADGANGLRQHWSPSRVRLALTIVGHLVLAGAIVALAFWVFQPTLVASFVYDDHETIIANRLIDHLSLDTLRRLFGGVVLSDYYPVFYLSLAIDRATYDMHPTGFHLTNVRLHLVNVLLVYALALRLVLRARRLSGGPADGRAWLIAPFAALLFAVHPNHVEPVAWITGRKVLLAGLWSLLAVHVYLTGLRDGGRRPWAVVVSCLCVALACMSNVYAVVVPALIVLVDRTLGPRGWWRAAWTNWPFALVAVAAIAVKVTSRIGGAARDSRFASRAEWLWTTVALYGDNVRSLFVPTGRNVVYPNRVISSPGDGAFVAGLIAAIVTVALIWTLRRRRLAVLGLLWFLLALAPTSQLARHHIFRADRYLYLPGMGACLLAGLIAGTAWAWSRSPGVRRGRRLAVVALCVVVELAMAGTFAVASRARTADWKDGEALWSASLEQDELNADAHQSLGCNLMRNGKYNEALRHLERCIELSPDHIDAHNTLSGLLLELGQFDRAVHHGRLAIQVRPDYPEAKFNLARALMAQGSYGSALAQFDAGLVLKPTDIRAHFYRAEVLAALGRVKQAIQTYEQTLDMNDRYVEARYGLALALIRDEQLDRARRELLRLVTDHPEFAEAHCRLGELAAQAGDPAGAIARFRKAVEARPDLPRPRNNLAWLLATCPDADLRNARKALALVEPLTDGAGREDPSLWDTLAAAHAAVGQYRQAVEAARRAATLAETDGNEALAGKIRKRLERYAASQPYVEPMPR